MRTCLAAAANGRAKWLETLNDIVTAGPSRSFAARPPLRGGPTQTRWFGMAVIGLSAIGMMFFIPAYPFWALTMIAVDVVALHGLCACGSRASLEAA
jgi:hypothetical protein